MFFKAEVHINKEKYIRAVNSSEFWTFAASEWYRLISPYTPRDIGNLMSNVTITAGEITYNSPYAHYLYEGQAMGPNIPLVKDGEIIGFMSKKGTKKHYTGKKLNISRSRSPKASAHWDKAAKPTELPKLARAMEKYVESGRLFN